MSGDSFRQSFFGERRRPVRNVGHREQESGERPVSTKEKTSIRVGARTEAAGGKSGETISKSNFNTSGGNSQGGGSIFDLLLSGEGSAIPGPELAKLAGINPRTLRSRVDRERENGALILASDAGYFKPADGSAGAWELSRFIRRQDSRCAANRRSTKPARAELKVRQGAPLDGQMEIQIGGNGDG